MERQEFTKSLRMFADFFDNNPLVPLPTLDRIDIWTVDKKEFINIIKLLGSGIKKYEESYIVFKTERFIMPLEVNIARGYICERVLVETKKVPELIIPEHDEEVYEWNCPESLLSE